MNFPRNSLTRGESQDPYDNDGRPGASGGRFEFQRMANGVPAVDGNRRQRHHGHGYRDRLQTSEKCEQLRGYVRTEYVRTRSCTTNNGPDIPLFRRIFSFAAIARVSVPDIRRFALRTIRDAQ